MGRTFLQGQTVEWVPNRNPGVQWEPSNTRNALPEAAEIPNRNESRNENSNKERTQKSWMMRILLVLVFVLLIVAGVVAWLFISHKNVTDNDNHQSSPISSLQDEDPPTSIPTTASPTGGPSAVSSSLPTALLELLYERPSGPDCDFISRNETIPGRDAFEVARFEMNLEVNLTDNTEMTEALLGELLDAIQEKILPSLAGCTLIIDQFVEQWRFVIFDAFVNKGNLRTDRECTDPYLVEQNCYSISLQLNLSLKGSVRFLDLIGLISDEVDNISNHLGLSDPFSHVRLIGAESLIPTVSPTSMPSSSLSRLLYAPPSDSNCNVISKNATIAGREDMEEAKIGFGLDVVLTEDSTNMTAALEEQLLDAVQAKILPSIVGCNIAIDKFVQEWRFVIFDAFVVKKIVPWDSRCSDDSLVSLNCHRLEIELHLFLKGPVEIMDIADLITDEENSIASLGHLGLPSDVFAMVRLDTFVVELIPTRSPTMWPSRVPSEVPSLQ